jgi:hypothetical protein
MVLRHDQGGRSMVEGDHGRMFECMVGIESPRWMGPRSEVHVG